MIEKFVKEYETLTGDSVSSAEWQVIEQFSCQEKDSRTFATENRLTFGVYALLIEFEIWRKNGNHL